METVARTKHLLDRNRCRRRSALGLIAVAILAATGIVLLAPRPVLSQGAAATVVGTLQDALTRGPIVEAVLQIEGVSLSALSDREGEFRFERVPPGLRTLIVTHMAYGEHRVQIEVAEGQSLEVELTLMSRAVALDPIYATAQSRLDRERDVRGTTVAVLDRTQIEELTPGARHVGDLVRWLPGVQVKDAVAPHAQLCLQSLRRIPSRPATGGMPEGQRVTGGCSQMAVFLDGVQIQGAAGVVRDGIPAGAGATVGDFLATLSPEDIESIEYLTPLQASTRYGTLAGAGVLEIFTRGNGPYSQTGPRSPSGTRRRGLDRQASLLVLVLSGVAGGTLGSIGGSMGGCSLGAACGVGRSTASASGLVGATAAIPLTVHLVNGRRGRLWATGAAAAVVGLVGSTLWSAADEPSPYLATVAGQVAAAVLVERVLGSR